MILGAIILLSALTAGLPAYAGSHVCFEAESATNVVALMQVGGPDIAVTNAGWTAVKGASGDRYLEIPQAVSANTNDEVSAESRKIIPGEAGYAFETEAEGKHYLWCRVWWLDSCGNSVGISIDGAKPFLFGQDGTFKVWHWVKAVDGLKQLKLEKGRHTMAIFAREDGVRIDQVILTDNSRFVPAGTEDVTQGGNTESGSK